MNSLIRYIYDTPPFVHCFVTIGIFMVMATVVLLVPHFRGQKQLTVALLGFGLLNLIPAAYFTRQHIGCTHMILASQRARTCELEAFILKNSDALPPSMVMIGSLSRSERAEMVEHLSTVSHQLSDEVHEDAKKFLGH